jgi:hypothetical protein
MHSLDRPTADLVHDYHWLVSQEGAGWLSAAQSMSSLDSANLLQVNQRLRRDLPPNWARLVLEQLDLRGRAQEKFPDAGRMFFTRLGLEQATDAWIARYKAARFASGQLLADLCCGIGGDLMALAHGGPVRGIDRDPVAAQCAKANLEAVGCRHATIITKDIEADDLNDVAAWHIDPDRRPAGRRTTKTTHADPAPDVLVRLLGRSPSAAIKLAPAAELAEPWWAEAELEWISRSRQCRQLVAWFGRLAEHPGHRRATILRAADASDEVQVTATFVGQPVIECPIAPQIGRYVLEPEAAILAAKLEGALAVQQQLSALAPDIAYYTADRPSVHHALACFEVLDVMPFRKRQLRAWLHTRGIGRLEIKKRGVPIDPETLRHQMQLDGPDEAVILLARIHGRVTAILARRVAANSSPESSPTRSSTG